MPEEHFTGSFESLFHYWQDPQRAKKFISGGTRTKAVQYLINRAEVEIHKGTWIDTAVGAAYPQTQLYDSVIPCLLVGIDFSRAMLDTINHPIERVLGSAFQLPVRDSAASISTNIFCLSDYPDPSKALLELERITKSSGIVMFMDYSYNDGYWTARKHLHDGESIVGNINLRNPLSIKQFLPEDMRIVQNIEITYEVNSNEFDSRVKLPKRVERAFLFVEMYKPRSS